MRTLCILCIFGMLAILGTAPARAEAVEQPRFTLSIGTYYIGYLPLPVAKALDLFRAEGLDVTVQNFGASGAKALQALVGGSTDVVVGGVDHTMQMQAQDKDVRCVILLNRSPGVVLAVRSELAGRIRSIA